jgi:hypothetical protein
MDQNDQRDQPKNVGRVSVVRRDPGFGFAAPISLSLFTSIPGLGGDVPTAYTQN